MRQAIPLDDQFPENDTLTRSELVAGYTIVEKHRERVSTGRRCWVDRIPQPDGRVEVRTYDHGRLVAVERVQPPAAPVRHSRGLYGTRLG